MKSCPDVGWDARNTAVHEVKHKDVLLPAENARKHSGMSHIACARGTELRAESNPRYAPWTKADSGYDAIFFFFFFKLGHPYVAVIPWTPPDLVRASSVQDSGTLLIPKTELHLKNTSKKVGRD